MPRGHSIKAARLRVRSPSRLYEHLLGERWMRPLSLPLLNVRVVRDVRHLWSDRLTPEEMRQVEKLIAAGDTERHP
jgi:hypothetical protein